MQIVAVKTGKRLVFSMRPLLKRVPIKTSRFSLTRLNKVSRIPPLFSSKKRLYNPPPLFKTMPQKKVPEKVLIPAALPYANGPIHIGHLLEYIQADIYSRFLKLSGKDALYICASDMHGTPIEVNARKAGETPENFALRFWKEHQEDFSRFEIDFDNFYKTHSPENKELAEYFFKELKK